MLIKGNNRLSRRKRTSWTTSKNNTLQYLLMSYVLMHVFLDRDFRGYLDLLARLVPLEAGGLLDTTAFQGRLERREKWYAHTRFHKINKHSITYCIILNILGTRWAPWNTRAYRHNWAKGLSRTSRAAWS